MTAAPQIDVRDLNSVRRAARALGARPGQRAKVDGGTTEVLLGEDWVRPAEDGAAAPRRARARRGLAALQTSPLARKIVTFNLVGLCLLVSGMLYLAPGRDNLVYQRGSGLVSETELIADVFEAQLPAGAPVNLITGDGIDPVATLSGLDLSNGIEVMVFDTAGSLVTRGRALQGTPDVAGLEGRSAPTVISDFVNRVSTGIAGWLSPDGTAALASPLDVATDLAGRALRDGTAVETRTGDGGTVLFVATPILQGGDPVGAIAVMSRAGEIDALLRQEREQVLQMFLVGILISVALSLMLASTIANPIAELAAAAEAGRDRNARKMSPDRIRIPDLSARPDEIGRLSAALRGMVAALYERIETNEQFAADVAHEIKNPLASLRSAVGTLEIVKKEEQRQKMLQLIEHDLQRLDRLVTDISSASRLDSELVREDEAPFDLLKMLGNLNDFLGEEARTKGIEFIADLPDQSIIVSGLEGRLAQVFVNLITNAISFCEDGDAIRIWARRRQNRVLIVVEDTGPGIPEEALTKIFQRFYSERPEKQFGNNSGLGLAISKQIVEAHGGVIWAENIRPTDADPTSGPLGARFVVGLPV
ncbi:sensor histidine kinase [Wenxinia saemankumensis]|uniref:histidine kinase n=1 Tax=Wenxinia saemankumensis TaxID=1447782 RepID=A0A1M6EEZ9_9RHOB|nr:sensor histidine kinase [Wenxinia saemankumensis]SHI83890.1 two-component system, OmpR family, sensor histidine kinase ChvG [Wenxinia saemankumensis]